MRIALVALVAVAMSGCITPGRFGPGPDGNGWGWKPVASKTPPSTLVARDGTFCTVTEDRFERIKVGDRAGCFWSGGHRPGAGTTP